MTRRIRIATDHPYEVVIGSDVHDELRDLVGPQAVRVAVIHPPTLARHAQAMADRLTGNDLTVHLLEVPDGEAAKRSDVLVDCWRRLGEDGLTRSDAVIGLGGGATTDLAGFVAATWLRGVRFVNVPTTVLGMVDAAVGGKTGINTDHGKNLVGSFHEPAGVLCDLSVLGGLPEPELRSGLAEVLKCGFIADPVILDTFESDPEAALDPVGPVLADLIARGIEVKAAAVTGDFREAGPAGAIGRESLNYGHTLGHAIERVSASDLRRGVGDRLVRHGEAISIGMVFVAELAHRSGRIDADLVQRHRSVLAQAGLPTTFPGDHWGDLLATMRLDKKARGDLLRFVVLDALGRPAILSGPDESVLAASFEAVSV